MGLKLKLRVRVLMFSSYASPMPRIMEEYACWLGQLFVCCEASILARSHPLDPTTVFGFSCEGS